METVGRFAQLFQGRTDFLGSEEGGCVRITTRTDGSDVNWDWIYQGHLTGTRPPIGIYPVVEYRFDKKVFDPRPVVRKTFAVKFGAIDIDVEDLPLAKNLWLALQSLNITAWVERSRSKGYHVWVFSEDWVPAVLMRSSLQVACDVVNYNPKEIYPKQIELADGSPGNYIRLPYPGWFLGSLADKSGRRAMLDLDRPEGGHLDLEDWVQVAWDTRVSRHHLEEAASLAAPPKAKHQPSVVGPRAGTYRDLAPLVAKMGGLAHTIWQNGPLEGADRSGTLYKLAHSLRESGLDSAAAFLLLEDADERWGKFSDRADKDDRLWEIIDRVWDDG